MYAVILTGGKQYKVSEGDIIRVEKLDVKEGDKVTFDQVLVLNDGAMKIGTPVVDGAKVSATVTKNGKAKKVIVFKMKRRKDYRKKNGHRAQFTEVTIKSVIA